MNKIPGLLPSHGKKSILDLAEKTVFLAYMSRVTVTRRKFKVLTPEKVGERPVG
jgi:hypothetical protein